MEDGETVCQDWGVYVQVVGLLGLGANLHLQLGYQFLVGGYRVPELVRGLGEGESEG